MCVPDFVPAFLFAGCLQRLEQTEVLLETAVDALLVEGQEFEVLRFDCEDARGDERGVDLRVLGGDFAGVIREANGEEVVFDGARAVETPAIGGYALSQLGFQGPLGHHGGDHGGGECVVSDAVFVTGLALHAYHGVMQHEAKVGQSFSLDLVLDIDLAEASRSDKLAHTVSYDQVVKVATEAFCGRRFRLVEAAAGAVADAVLAKFSQVRGLRVTVHKPHAPIAAIFNDVGVTIERRRANRANG